MTSADEREKILDKLRKLNAMAESAAEIGNEAEAQAFAGKVQELLTAYKLSQAELGSSKPEEPIDVTYLYWKDLGMNPRKVRVGWTERLAGFVANAYYCDFVVCGWGGAIGFFVGAATDRKIATYMFVTLGRFLSDLADREYVKEFYRCKALGDVTLCRGFKAGFTYGFLMRLRERFEEDVRPKVDPLEQSRSTAIVHVRKDSLAKVKAWEKDHLDLRTVHGTRLNDGGNSDGRKRGRAAADAVNLSGKAMESGPRAQLRD